MKATICIIDDDQEMRALLEDFLLARNYAVQVFSLAADALDWFEKEKNPEVDLIISDIKMPKLDGISFVRQLQKSHPHLPIVLVTAFGSIETAIEAMRAGAFDYIVKPFKLTEMELVIERALKFRKLHQENDLLRMQAKGSWKFGEIIGKAPAMQKIFDLIKRVATVNSNILITGDSGTGKELVARAIHNNGPRANMPFVAINCTAIPENLLESELFGHAKGSFTGAHQRKKGLFEEANGGTIFLDEIGDMDLSLQAKILRVLQDRQIRPVGDANTISVDLRVISATHKDLKKAIQEKTFREDLYFRLSVIPIEIPSLSERRQDIPLLADYFLKKYAAQNGIQKDGFTKGAMESLEKAPWHGNVRELENVIERAVVLSTASRITCEDLPNIEQNSVEDFFNLNANSLPTVSELEKRYIKYVLHKVDGKKNKAADVLGINRRTLYRKEREYGMVDATDTHLN